MLAPNSIFEQECVVLVGHQLPQAVRRGTLEDVVQEQLLGGLAAELTGAQGSYFVPYLRHLRCFLRNFLIFKSVSRVRFAKNLLLS